MEAPTHDPSEQVDSPATPGTEEALVASLLAGSREAAEALVEKTYGAVYARL